MFIKRMVQSMRLQSVRTLQTYVIKQAVYITTQFKMFKYSK